MVSQFSLGMQFRGAQNLKQSQRLMMSPQMQQAIHLLQVPISELAVMIDRELEQNPILEYLDLTDVEGTVEDKQDSSDLVELDFNDANFSRIGDLDDFFGSDEYSQEPMLVKEKERDETDQKSYIEQTAVNKKNLYSFLMEQVNEFFLDIEDRLAAGLIVGYLNERGYLDVSLLEISGIHSYDLERLKSVLKIIHEHFEPCGVGASNEKESMLIQLTNQGKKETLSYKIVEECFDELIHNKLPLIKKRLKVSLEEIRDAIEADLLNLTLRPGMDLFQDPTLYIIPDVRLIKTKEGFKIIVNEDEIPSVQFNPYYLELLSDSGGQVEVRDYVQQKVASGKWLMRNISQRNVTLYRLADCLLKYQLSFFESSEGQLQPLTMKMVAEDLELHESTVARAVANKYMDTPRGILPLRYFFTNGYETQRGEEISSQSVKSVLLELIQGEDKKHPYSDEEISALLQQKSIQCARRTVAKYRKELQIGTASQRKKYN